jgi:nitrite reductase/ring-hydroxylating ferredoxin subunit
MSTVALLDRIPSLRLLDPAGRWVDRRLVYQDPAFLALECRTLWPSHWLAALPLEDLARPGAVVPLDLAGVPLLAVRDAESVRLLSNVCRHRAMRLCATAGQHQALTCPYHGWRYALDGQLLMAPQRARQLPDLDPTRLRLAEVPSTELAGLLLGRLESPGDAAPRSFPSDSDDPVALVAKELADHDPPTLPVVLRRTLVAACNWKLLVENHLDGYHLWYLHQRSLGAYDHRRFTSRFRPDGTWTSFEPLRPAAPPPSGLVPVPNLSRVGMGAHLLFPGLLIVTTPWWLATAWLEPLAPDRTRLHLVVRGTEGSDPEALLDDVLGFVREDIDACEAVQAALGSGVPEGPLARTLEADLVGFRRVVAEICGAPA